MHDYFLPQDSDSDIYSPVCSDNEEEPPKKDFDILTFIYENDEIGKVEETNADLHDDLQENDESSNMTGKDEESPDNTLETEKTKRHENIPELLKQIEEDPLQFILQLIWKVSLQNSDASAFVRPQSLMIFHKVCSIVQRPNEKIFQIVENILTQSRNFMAILKQDYISKIHELSRPSYSHQDCYSCSRMKIVSQDLLHAFGSVAESGYGRGEVAHFLLTGDEEMRKRIVVNLTYVISIPEILNDLLFKYRALETIMSLIFSGGIFAVEACDGLTVMANNLNIQVQSEDDVLQKIIPEDFIEDADLFQIKGEQVKFILKDGEVLFEKEKLMNSSEVFHSMLSGSFRESNRNEVHFPNYTVEGMKYFYQVLNLDIAGKLKQIAPKASDMSILLQAYELSILYILTSIQKPLLNVIKIVLDESSVLKIFEWSLHNINQELLISAICYFLCGNIEGSAKLRLFREANQSQFNDEWRKLLIDTILMRCQP